jgi:hypothetical protein
MKGRDGWHQRYYRPSVNVIQGTDRIWFEESGLEVEAYPLSVLKGAFQGRCNLLLSGPSVRGIEAKSRLAENDWIGVNGSPALFGDAVPRMKIYHVNDATFIRSSLSRFLAYANQAEYTVIDYRAMYGLLQDAAAQMPKTKLVIYDSWAYPHLLPLGKIQALARPPEYKGVYLSTDIRLGLAVGGTVAYTAAQIAWHGGYDSLYIYGLDLTSAGRFYKESSPQPQMLDKAFDRVIMPAFELLVRETAPSCFRIFNCNPNSRLPSSIIPQLDLNESLTHQAEQN